MNNDAKDTLQFFVYDHLSEHLQGMSKPFADLAHALMRMSPEQVEEERDLIQTSQARSVFSTLIGEIDRATPPNYQATRAVNKIDAAKSAFARLEPLNEVLNLLLEAKDCAVRSLIFKPQG